MKELSIEQKAKAYDEAIKRAIKHHDNDGLTLEQYKTIDIIFPELKESEDERIRKAILNYFTKCWGNCKDDVCGIHVEDAIAWIEKQCDKPQGKSALEAIKEEKVEPKFHKGDWVVDNECGKVNQITLVRNQFYDFANGDYMSYESAHKELRLWSSIVDANDGDVLQLGKVTAIFQEYIGNGNCKCYCSVCDGEFEVPSQNGADNSYGCHNATPATKEQRDTLMKAMADAGYTFDFEKKELKKIEQEPAEWSEEDEKMFRSLHNLIYVVHDCDCDYKGKKELSDFLVSVKNRVQPQLKQEWTEEDKKCIRLSTDIIDSALRAGFCVQLDRDRCIDWLKSLKPQNKWKPSDAQMQALKEACDKHWEPDGLDPLYTLYEQLKKL